MKLVFVLLQNDILIHSNFYFENYEHSSNKALVCHVFARQILFEHTWTLHDLSMYAVESIA